MRTDFPSHFFFNSQGSTFRVRPIFPTDKEVLQKAFGELSVKSRYLRLFQTSNTLTEAQLKYFTEVDAVQHVAWGILDETDGLEVPVGIGRFVRFKEEQDVAEVAITVTDNYQGRGLGRVLFATLNYIAGQMGLKKLRYYVLSENRYTLNALKKFTILNQINEGPLTILDIMVIPNYKAIPDQENMERIINAMKMVENKMEA